MNLRKEGVTACKANDLAAQWHSILLEPAVACSECLGCSNLGLLAQLSQLQMLQLAAYVHACNRTAAKAVSHGAAAVNALTWHSGCVAAEQ